MPDSGKKSFPWVYRYPMEAKKVFHGSIGIRWRQKKFSMGLSVSDGDKKSFPWGYRCPMAAKKVFHGAIDARWRDQKDSTPLSDSDGPPDNEKKRQGVSVVRTGTPSVYEKFCFFPKIIGLFYKNPRDVHCTKDVSYDGCNLKVTILKHSHFLSLVNEINK